MFTSSQVEALLRRDRLVVFTGLAVVVAISVAYTISGVGMEMSALTMTRMAVEMPGMVMQAAVWSPAYASVVFLMWWVMMIAMMVPSAAPAILIFAGIARKREPVDNPVAATFLFLAGYLVAWGVFSLVATLLQMGLERAGAITGMMEIANPLLAGAVLIAAGLYQLTPLKQACLKHCRHPLLFLMHRWKPGRAGALRMGWEHGIFCLGCCWFLMALLFVGGIMNLIWIAGIALYVGIEKLGAGRRSITTVAGVALTIAGIGMIAKTVLY